MLVDPPRIFRRLNRSYLECDGGWHAGSERAAPENLPVRNLYISDSNKPARPHKPLEAQAWTCSSIHRESSVVLTVLIWSATACEPGDPLDNLLESVQN